MAAEGGHMEQTILLLVTYGRTFVQATNQAMGMGPKQVAHSGKSCSHGRAAKGGCGILSARRRREVPRGHGQGKAW
jgi:hypothetical protein